MPVDHTEIKQAVHAILNDVVEQCFHYMVNCPEHGDDLNKIIQEASTDIKHFNERIDRSVMECNESDLKENMSVLTKDLHKKSLILLSKLQKIQRSVYESGSDQMEGSGNSRFSEEDI